MKALLMHPDNDFDAKRLLPAHAEIVRQDLALNTLLAAMADGDEFVSEVACNALLNGCKNDAATITYRQNVITDALAHAEPVRQMYSVATAALEEKRKSYWGFLSSHPSSILYSSLQVLRIFMERLRQLRGIAEANASRFESSGFRNLFAMLEREFDDAYLERVAAQLEELKFADGTLVSAQIGPGGESDGYTLRRPHDPNPNWLKRMLERGPRNFTVKIAQRDLIGAKTLAQMRDRGINEVANALAQSVDHIQGFFEMLRVELAFHVGCVSLHEKLTAKGVKTCLPGIGSADTPGFHSSALLDVALALTKHEAVIGNTIDANGKQLVIITGANQGGKSTFLRSLGLAQLMLQAGMFVSAEAFSAALCTGLFTHYKREEDASMEQGKFDEELARISDIADAIRPGALLLCNESFAATDEREGSEIARQVTDAMLERHIRVVFVTHQFHFAQGICEQNRPDALFLRAERRDDGTRTFKLKQGAPRETSFGNDLFVEIFGPDQAADSLESHTEPATTIDCPSRAAQGAR
ncbi:MAG: MutS-related protein [Rhodanobacteraceae bacterium]